MANSLIGSIRSVALAIIVGLLLISLAMWGVSDAFTPNSKDAAAMVGDNKIKLRDFDRSFQLRLRNENEQTTERMSIRQAIARGLHRDVLNQMITNELVSIDADDLGVDVNRRDAREFVESLGVYNNAITGKYDEKKLRNVLSRQDSSMTVKRFEEEVYNALRQDQTLASITGGIIAPQAYSDQSYKFMTEQRRVKLLTLGRNAVEKPENPNNEELKAYIAEHQGQYTAPEYRRFTLLRVEVSDLLPDMEASEEKIADLFDYKLKAELLGSPETRSIARIVSMDKATADRATLALNTGKNADAVASEFGLDEPTVYTDILPGATMDPKTGEAAFKMGQGKAETLESSLGTWYSVIVTGITPATIPDMENEREALVTEIKTEKAERFIYDVQDVIQEALDTGATLEEAALGSDVAVASYDFVSSIGENQKGDRMAGLEGWPGISEDDRILTEVFTSEPGFEGNIFETANKGIAAIRVDEIKESARRSFEEVKAQALEAWHLEQANKALATLMDEVADKAAAGESLEVLAAGFEKGAKLRESLMLRAAPPDDLSRHLAIRLFEARSGQTVRGVGANGLDRVVGQVVEIVPNEDILTGTIADTFKEQMAEQINNDIQQAYRVSLLDNNPARSFDENIQKTLGLNDRQ